jgi:hypothetical protein
MNYTELKPLLPTKWEDIKLKDYMKISEAIVTTEEGLDEVEQSLQMVDNIFNIVSKLTGISLVELMTIDMKDIKYVCADMSFIFTEIEPSAIHHPKMKTDVDTSYSNYITYSNLSGDPTMIAQSLPVIVESFLKDVSTEEIMDMNIVDVMTIFFCQVKLLRKYMKTTRQSLLWTIIVQRIKEIKLTILSKLIFWKKAK